MTLRKMDLDKDGRVSSQDWKQTIQKEPLMLEAFGTCLPNKKAGELFLEKTRDSDWFQNKVALDVIKYKILFM